MQKFIIAVVLLLGILLILTQFAELQAIVMTIRQGDWIYIALAIIVQAVWFINMAAAYRAIYKALGMEESLRQLLLLTSSADFVNVVAPTAGMSGMAVFIAAANKKGISAARVTVAGVLYVFFDYFSFLLVLVLGLTVLFRRNNLNEPELVASAMLALIAAVMAMLILLGMRSGEALGKVLAWMAQQVNWIVKPFVHREYLSEQYAHQFANDAAEGLALLKKKPRVIGFPVGLALFGKGLLITVLWLTFLAFQVPFSIGTLIAGFSIGYLFLIISPTPMGIGVVEGALAIGLNTLNVPLSAATVIALTFRGVTFWLPLLFRMAAFRYMTHHGLQAPA